MFEPKRGAFTQISMAPAPGTGPTHSHLKQWSKRQNYPLGASYIYTMASSNTLTVSTASLCDMMYAAPNNFLSETGEYPGMTASRRCREPAKRCTLRATI